MVAERINRTVLVVVAMVGLCARLVAQDGFEGLATVGRFGRFPSGLYGATNVVAANSVVRVRNLETGVVERIVITEGVAEPGVFLVLSPEAATLLGITTSGVTRVRLTEVVPSAFRTPDVATEQPLSRDPEVNPRALQRSLVDTLPPPPVGVVAEPVQPVPPPQTREAIDTAREPEPVVTPPLVDADVSEPVAEAPFVRPPEPIPVLPEPQIVAPAPRSDEPPTDDAGRRGIASGIARSGIARVQDDFERPEATLPRAERVDTQPVFEPTVPRVAPVATDEPDAPAHAADRLAEPDAPVVDRPGIVDLAIRAVTDRLPRKDPFPSPAGDDRENGLLVTPRPRRDDVVAELPAAVAPAIERPAMAGIGPLRAASDDFVPDLAVAVAPQPDRPDAFAPARIGMPTLTDVMLAEAVPGDPDVPDVDLVMGPRPQETRPDAVLASPTERAVTRDAPQVADAPSPVPDEPEDPAWGIVRRDATDPPLPDSDPPVAAVREPESPDPGLIRTADERADAAVAVATPLAPDPARVEAAEPPDVRPVPAPEDAILTLEPADFRPPVVPRPEEDAMLTREAPGAEPEPAVAVTEAPRVEPATVEAPRVEPTRPVVEPAPVVVEPPRVEPAPTQTAVVDADGYYLQVGAFSNRGTADVTVDAFASVYPMAIVPVARDGATIYRVLVGPLERDETGTLLLWFRSRGYRDTFVRSGREL
ncbi:MAG: hypothetical protein EA382_06495 [Spirochaetaceae bacterium]|nr:MAG: hypothetical protein EA382_06495 [Spirochaetaceae bacterium]